MSLGAITKDLAFGEASEDCVIEKLKQNGWEIKRGTKTSIIDFYMEKPHSDGRRKPYKYYAELKTRTNSSTAYLDTMIGANKLAEAWQKYYKDGVETLFLFAFTDGLFYHNPILAYRTEYRAGRFGRGSNVDKPKGWVFVKGVEEFKY